MSRRGGGCLTAAAVALSLVVLALAAGLVCLVLTNGAPTAEVGAPLEEELVPKAFDEYAWGELSEVAAMISSAPSDEEGRAIAEKYGVSVGSVRPLALDDGRTCSLTVVGIRADERADGSGVSGLTLMASPISVRAMNEEETNAGGWESSDLRSWLAAEGMGLLPDELAEAIVPVRKLTNNVGVTSDAASVTETDDSLWLFSASEVCGTVTWFTDEYGVEPNAHTGYVDFAPYDALLNLEGEQYEYFSAAGVSASSDPQGALRLTYGGSETSWWYRTAYPFTYVGGDECYFYQVMASGYPSTTGLATSASGVTVGFCL